MIDQIAIAICGATAVWCSQAPHARTQRWACVAGLIGQPAWFYATISAQQWGMVAVCVLYTLGWLRGIKTYWLANCDREPLRDIPKPRARNNQVPPLRMPPAPPPAGWRERK